MKKTTYEFCLRILSLGVSHSKALANLVMSLCGDKAGCIAELSNSPVCHYQYSSLHKSVHHLADDGPSLEKAEREALIFCMSDYLCTPEDETYSLNTDKTPISKPHSPTHEGRYTIAIPNHIARVQTPLSVGHEYSVVGLYVPQDDWALPLSYQMISADKTASEVAVEQINGLMKDESLPFHQALLVSNAADSGYATGTYIDGVKDIDNLISIVRLRSSSKVYPRNTSSSKAIYGQAHYLIPKSGTHSYKKHRKTGQPYLVQETSITEQSADEDVWVEDCLKNGRKVKIRIRQWNNLLFRTKQGIRMSDKPFNLLMIEVFDAQTMQLVFQTPLYLAVFGKKRLQLSPLQIYRRYRHRFSIEVLFRFCKQHLLLQNYQAANLQYFKNWSLVVLLATWLLFSARNELKPQCPKWQKYYEAKRKKTTQTKTLSVAQVKKAILPLLLTFDTQHFIPKKSKPGKGRKPGTKLQPKKFYKFIKKQTKATRKPPS
jgi:Transposase DDE domain